MRGREIALCYERQFNGLDAHLERGSTAVGRPPPFDPLPPSPGDGRSTR